MRIFGWLCDHSGCGYYRIKQPFRVLQNLGYDVICGGNMPLDIATGNVDVVIAQRVVLPGPTEWLKKAVTKSLCKVIFELDDDLFNIDGSNKIAHGFFNQEMQTRAIEVLSIADQVTTTTDQLAERMSQYTSAPIEVIPNHISRWLTEHEPDRRSDVTTIGWAGSATHESDWGEAASEIRRFIKRTNGVEIHTMGHNLTARWEKARFTWWNREIDDYLRSIDFHIGLAPLRPSVFNKSKSALKAMEYGALGIPAIASNCGPYADYVVHGETGFLVNRPHEWAAYLRELTNDLDLAARMGQQARDYVKKNSVIEDNIWRWEKVLKS